MPPERESRQQRTGGQSPIGTTNKSIGRPQGSVLPHWFVDEVMVDLTGSAVKVYIAMLRHAINADRLAFPSQQTLMRLTGLSRDSVIDGLRTLVARGLLVPDGELRQGRLGRYRVPAGPPEVGGSEPEGDVLPWPTRQARFEDETGGWVPVEVVEKVDKSAPPKLSRKSTSPPAKVVDFPRQVGALEVVEKVDIEVRDTSKAGEVAFSEWWNVYPRKINQPAAWAAWQSLMKNEHPDPLLLIAATRVYARDEKSRFWSLPEKFLREAMWVRHVDDAYRILLAGEVQNRIRGREHEYRLDTPQFKAIERELGLPEALLFVDEDAPAPKGGWVRKDGSPLSNAVRRQLDAHAVIVQLGRAEAGVTS